MVHQYLVFQEKQEKAKKKVGLTEQEVDAQIRARKRKENLKILRQRKQVAQ